MPGLSAVDTTLDLSILPGLKNVIVSGTNDAETIFGVVAGTHLVMNSLDSPNETRANDIAILSEL